MYKTFNYEICMLVCEKNLLEGTILTNSIVSYLQIYNRKEVPL